MDADRTDLTGVPFFKMTGSGNDFVFLDGRSERLRALEKTDVIQRICRRGTGIGADGVVWLLPPGGAEAFRMRYRNSDGSIADMCGNAALCSVQLAFRLGLVQGDRPFEFATDAGMLTGRRRRDGLPEVTLTPARGLAVKAPVAPVAPEVRIGLVNTGVPHLVVLVPDAEAVDLDRRGRELRSAPELGSAGANVNFVSKRSGAFRMRTFERGVEAETLACGTGAAACAMILNAWGDSTGQTTIETTSGGRLVVSIRDSGGAITPSLAGEGRLVYAGEIGSV